MSRLIDADAVILNYGGLVHISPYDFQGIVKYFAEQISAAPTIDAVPVVRGKWIKCDVEKWRNGALKCSECGKGYHLPHEVTLFDWNFCPNCGADMRGEQDDESRSNSNAQTDTRARGMGATDKSSGI